MVNKKKKVNDVLDPYGATIRKNKDSKEIRLIFSADETYEGVPYILDVLKTLNIKGSFFLTGNALRNKDFEKYIHRMINEGHYLGGHADKHLQYAAWQDRTTLVSNDSLLTDLKNNYDEHLKWGIEKQDASYFLPPFEFYNQENINAIKTFDIEPINYTKGIRTAADYTTPDMKNYMSSQKIIDQLYLFETESGLGGTIILIHPGTVKERTDKLYYRLEEIIQELQKRGYHFVSF